MYTKYIKKLLTSLFFISVSLIILNTDSIAKPDKRPLFEEIDKNNDGLISKEDIKKYTKSNFEKSDGNGDGLITADEMMENFLSKSDKRRNHFRKRFQKEDLNDDGEISQDEMIKYLRKRENKNSRISLRAILRNMNNLDSNGDNMISKEEMADQTRKNFEDIDVNGDDSLSRLEMINSHHMKLQKRINAAKKKFANADGNGDGALSEREMIEMLDKEARNRTEIRIKRSIEYMDNNQDGTISFKETELARNGSIRVNIFNRLDNNNDGLISKSEYNSDRKLPKL